MSSRDNSAELSIVRIRMDNLTKQAIALSTKYTSRRFARAAYTFGTGLLLFASMLYVGWHANRVYSNIQDATIYPYLFKNFRLHDLVLPGDHPNILKFPLFWLQSVLPYNFATLTIVDFCLFFATVFGWCFLLARLFGKRLLPFLFILMAAILLGSASLTLNLIETTIRNIEYPIGLAFMMALGHIYKDIRFHRHHLATLAILVILFTLSLSGDSFMLYAFIAPPVLVVLIDWLQTGVWSRHATKMLAVATGVAICSATIHHLVALLGIAHYYLTSNLQAKIVPINSFGPSIAHAISQVPDLAGANIFGLPITTGNSLYFVNFVLLIVGVAGLFSIMHWAFPGHNNEVRTFDIKRFTLGSLALSALTTFGAYIFSGLAVTRLPNGTFVDASNIRYLTLLPFLCIAGATFLFTRMRGAQRPLIWVTSVMIVLSIPLSIASIRTSSIGWSTFVSTSQYDIQSTVSTLRAHHVTQIVAGDSIAAPIRFWSHGQIQFAPLIGCREYAFQNTRLSWRQPSSQSIITALVIDRVGYDRAFMGLCSDAQLKTIFGKPMQVIIPSRYHRQPTLYEIWIYHRDIRKSLRPRD